MEEIRNIITLAKDEQANINRATIEHRATWMGLIYDKFRRAGINPEPMFRKTIRKYGNVRGENFKTACPDPEDYRDFTEVFLNDLERKTFEQEVHQVAGTGVPVDFHYCTLLDARKKLGFGGGTCAVLRDIAMDGDRGIVEAMGLDLESTDILTKGCPTCKLCFRK